ncbi:hypothetical protein WN943_016349 [Citrus x changshan-huyou]
MGTRRSRTGGDLKGYDSEIVHLEPVNVKWLDGLGKEDGLLSPELRGRYNEAPDPFYYNSCSKTFGDAQCLSLCKNDKKLRTGACIVVIDTNNSSSQPPAAVAQPAAAARSSHQQQPPATTSHHQLPPPAAAAAASSSGQQPHSPSYSLPRQEHSQQQPASPFTAAHSRQPARLARNCAVRSPFSSRPTQPNKPRSADVVATSTSEIKMSDSGGSRIHESIQSTESNEVSDISPMATGAQSESKRKRSSKTSSKPPQPRKVMAPRSKVWQDFTKLPEDYNRCKCNYCGQEYSCKSTDGTSSLSNHLKRCLEYESYLQNQTALSQETIGVGNEEVGQVVVRGFNQEVIRRATAKMIILDELPFSHVENSGFRHFCSVACSRFMVPSRRTITKDILDIFLSEKASLKSLLCYKKQRVSLTTDIWTSITTASYMVITAHFIDQDWQLRRRIISFNTISDHKGETIGKQLEKCLLDWGIERVFTVTVDNASANKVAITYLTNKLKTWRDGALVLNGDFIHVRCCAHIMNLIVNEGLKKLDNSIISIHNAVKYVRSSTARLKAFQIRVEQEKILGKNGQPSRGSVVLDCPTRWNSTYTMLTTALKFRSAFDRMAYEDKLYDAYFHEEEGGKKKIGPPGSYDWDNARRMVKFLRIFYEATLSFSSSLRVTSSTCYNEICKVEKALNTMADSLDPHISMIASSMKEKFEEYWEGSSKINKSLIVASILDPRGKMNFPTLCFETLYGKDSAKCAEMKNVVKDVLNKLFEAYSAQHFKPSASASASASAFPSESVSAFPSESAGISANSGLTFMDEDDEVFEDPFSKYTEMVAVTRDHIEFSNELDLYLMESVEYQVSNALGAPFDILLWWKANSSKYPILSQIARDVLAIPVSTVASESAFSTGGRILDEYRSSMTPDMVEALILTQNWLRTSLFVDSTTNLQVLVEENEFMDALTEVQNPIISLVGSVTRGLSLDPLHHGQRWRISSSVVTPSKPSVSHGFTRSVARCLGPSRSPSKAQSPQSLTLTVFKRGDAVKALDPSRSRSWFHAARLQASLL